MAGSPQFPIFEIDMRTLQILESNAPYSGWLCGHIYSRRGCELGIQELGSEHVSMR